MPCSQEKKSLYSAQCQAGFRLIRLLYNLWLQYLNENSAQSTQGSQMIHTNNNNKKNNNKPVLIIGWLEKVKAIRFAGFSFSNYLPKLPTRKAHAEQASFLWAKTKFIGATSYSWTIHVCSSWKRTTTRNGSWYKSPMRSQKGSYMYTYLCRAESQLIFVR